MRTVDVAWGEEGLEALAESADVLVVVDVLSFTTCVSIAVARGATIRPARIAEEAGRGVVAGRRRSGAAYTLSPASFLSVPRGEHVTLPSVNGATLSRVEVHQPVLAGALRNRRAVAAGAIGLGPRIGIVAAGERWPSGGLRPALEDWLGAGAIAVALRPNCELSGMARAAAAAFQEAELGIGERLRMCPSGLELVEWGFPGDVELASSVDADACVPRLLDGAYTDSRRA